MADQRRLHVFLRGDRGSGKTWTVRRAAELTGRPCCGFVTFFADGDLYMAAPLDTEAAQKVAERRDGKMRPLPGTFDEAGTALLSEARKHPEGLILMDECGHLEKEEARFRQEILRCLDGDIPVLGVLRKGQDWHREIENHPRVTVLGMEEGDHEALAEKIAGMLEGKA